MDTGGLSRARGVGARPRRAADPACSPTGSERGALRCGVDVASSADVSDLLERFGDRYRARVFTEREVADCSAPVRAVEARSLAARFAAKEAAMKALHAAVPAPRWRDVEVVRAGDGSCFLELHGRALEIARAADVREMAMSLAHEGDVAVAFVVALS
ncbi:MAG: 4'-phosphopantetheinyl transferase superfamily protein [Actinomycetota bacterium]|nr:4'-phosphopantetheinyl transferase superfamily protein [Actinomycetota bacterium]